MDLCQVFDLELDSLECEIAARMARAGAAALDAASGNAPPPWDDSTTAHLAHWDAPREPGPGGFVGRVGAYDNPARRAPPVARRARAKRRPPAALDASVLGASVAPSLAPGAPPEAHMVWHHKAERAAQGRREDRAAAVAEQHAVRPADDDDAAEVFDDDDSAADDEARDRGTTLPRSPRNKKNKYPQ